MLHGAPDGAREPFGCGAINILLLTEQGQTPKCKS